MFFFITKIPKLKYILILKFEINKKPELEVNTILFLLVYILIIIPINKSNL